MVSVECELLSNEEDAPGHYVMALAAPEIAAEAQPGQFVHLRTPRTFDPLLRRPFSIMLADKVHGHLRLLAQVVGRGTEILVNTPVGAKLEVLGPLGTGFPLPTGDGDVLMVAGGVGVAPLISLADALRGFEHPAYIRGLFGAADEDMLVCWIEFAGRCDEFYVTTEDGSAGERGLITEALAQQLDRGQAAVAYTCGPVAMMAAVAQMCGDADVPCYCSLEQRMGCGIGACLGCVIAAADGGYLRVCKDGPVFATDRLDWEAILSDQQ